uniref:Uncharacterized protein n=1 Tax=Glossina austeni TaxID=7395 RepID=A0A1A9UQD0_GLOAU
MPQRSPFAIQELLGLTNTKAGAAAAAAAVIATQNKCQSTINQARNDTRITELSPLLPSSSSETVFNATASTAANIVNGKCSPCSNGSLTPPLQQTSPAGKHLKTPSISRSTAAGGKSSSSPSLKRELKQLRNELLRPV